MQSTMQPTPHNTTQLNTTHHNTTPPCCLAARPTVLDNDSLAALLQRYGCTQALNLDGGGSSTFWLEGAVRNSPSGRRERPLANALIFLRPPPPP